MYWFFQKNGIATIEFTIGHISWSHELTGGHTCPTTGKRYSTKNGVETHIISPHENIKFDCNICNKTFTTKGALRYHQETIHEGKRPSLNCPLCDKIFNEKSRLKRHIDNVHEKLKPFSCDLCDMSFAQNGQLKTHKRGKHRMDC